MEQEGRVGRTGLGDYFKGLWKYMRTPTDRELAEFFMELSASVYSTGSLDEVRRWIGSGLPSKQITIKSLRIPLQQVQKLIGEEGG
jgi:hypothetical protein